MPVPQTNRPARISTGDRVRISPANGEDRYTVTATDLGAWGMTAQLGARLVFIPWSAIDLVVRLDADDEAAEELRSGRTR